MERFYYFVYSLLLLLRHTAALSGSFNPSGNDPTAPGPPGTANDFSKNHVFKQGDQMHISFITNVTIFNVVIWQNGCRAPYTIKKNTSSNDFDWTVDITALPLPIKPFDSTVFGNVAYLGVTEPEPNQSFFTSHYFNFTDPDDLTVTTTSSMSAPTGAPSISSPSVVQATASPSNTAQHTMTQPTVVADSSSGSNQLRPGAVAGIAVATSLGTLLVGTLLAFLIVLRRRRRPAPPLKASLYGRIGSLGAKEGNDTAMSDIHLGVIQKGPGVTVRAFEQQRPSQLGPDLEYYEAVAHVPVSELPVSTPSR